MTLKEIQESDWYKERPKIIQDAIDIMPPTQLYKFKSSGKQCFIYGYDEPESDNVEDVTLHVNKTGIGGAMAEAGLGMLDKNWGVFDVKMSDLEVWED